jgi:hypothetical protein
MNIPQNARDFCIWRVGKSVNWKCTIREIAEETGLDRTTVTEACLRHGWPVRSNEEGDYLTRCAIAPQEKELAYV